MSPRSSRALCVSYLSANMSEKTMAPASVKRTSAEHAAAIRGVMRPAATKLLESNPPQRRE